MLKYLHTLRQINIDRLFRDWYIIWQESKCRKNVFLKTNTLSKILRKIVNIELVN